MKHLPLCKQTISNLYSYDYEDNFTDYCNTMECEDCNTDEY
jgi:hypothetical protein